MFGLVFVSCDFKLHWYATCETGAAESTAVLYGANFGF